MSALTPERHFAFVCVCIAVALGFLFRAPFYIVNDFVLGDGGMFAAIIDTIRAGGYAYPDFAGYNHQNIPFAYPPLMFYAAALTTDALGVSTLTTLTYLPLFVNLLSIGAFVFLATRLLEDRGAILLAAVIFPLLPWSYEAMIMAGGLTRGSGLLFMLLALYAATHLHHSLLSVRSKPFLATLIFLCLAALSHPETGISTAFALTLFVLSRSHNQGKLKDGVAKLVVLGVATAVLTVPWWGTVLAKHGPSPFLAASNSSMWSLGGFMQQVTTMSLFDVARVNLALAVIAGGLVCIVRKKWFLPVWFVLMFLVTPRKAPSFSSVPYALLSAIGIYAVVSYLIEWLAASKVSSAGVNKLIEWMKERSSLVPNYALVLALLCLGYVAVGQLNGSSSLLWSLTDEELAAMRWVEQKTPPDANFVVLTPFSQAWENDYQAEWFPYLTKRRSLTTVQGLEWVPDNAFNSKIEEVQKLVYANYQGDMLRTVESTHNSFEYVAFFTPLDDFAEEYNSRYEGFVESDRYRLVYDSGSCLIFERIDDAEFVPSVG